MLEGSLFIGLGDCEFIPKYKIGRPMKKKNLKKITKPEKKELSPEPSS